ncbi:hypothetical protein LX64_00684 [Chitinophaga skermanii]|uniref:Uncharacterized protein n=1 Tax=Chitinophaga skermanii TaxID=331697 RepID=A0A327R2M9_9BACT|nr:hypothetical protein LX64_00684 [Chitinophaga skermanii]
MKYSNVHSFYLFDPEMAAAIFLVGSNAFTQLVKGGCLPILLTMTLSFWIV